MTLDRKVDLKFLSHKLQRDWVTYEPFLQEARAATLDHFPICEIYEIKKGQVKTLTVLQYLQDQSLKAQLQTRPLATHEGL